jgi:colanic acid/amylovoran biosynthesis glycosyltransferase
VRLAAGGRPVTTVAYIANQFPSPLEPYVMDEVGELRRHGVRVICCSGKRIPLHELSAADRAFRDEARVLWPLSPPKLAHALRRLGSDRRALRPVLHAAFQESNASRSRRLRALGHTLLGAALANELASLEVEHIHAHHGYFASWMALVAARLLGIGFSLTLHGSDLLLHGNLLAAKLRFCRFCVTVSNFNRDYIFRRFPSIPESKVLVQRLGVDCVPSSDEAELAPDEQPFLLLSVGRLNRVKNHRFLIQACAALRDEGRAFRCWIAGEGPERPALEHQIEALQLQAQVRLLGHIPRNELSDYYRRAGVVLLTSLSEGIPVVLMEAMARQKLVLAPAITGIPELVEHARTGFLYEPGSMRDFLDVLSCILDRRSSLAPVRRAAAASVSANYNRQRNLRSFADHFLERIASSEHAHENPLLQQVQLSV